MKAMEKFKRTKLNIHTHGFWRISSHPEQTQKIKNKKTFVFSGCGYFCFPFREFEQ